MNAQEKKDDLIKAVLEETHNAIQPQDSWEALKSRIEKRIFYGRMPSVIFTRLSGNAVFWRRLALALAACLVLMTGLFIYVLNDSQNNRQEQIKLAGEGLINPMQAEQLSSAFAQVRELFGTHCPWMVIGSGGEGEIGVSNQTVQTADSNKIIIMRLAVNVEGQEIPRRYFDVVTFSNRQVSFNMSIAESSNIGVSIRPVINTDGKIVVEIDADLDSGKKTSDTVTVVDDKFTSLVRIKSGSNRVDIDAVGKVMSNI